MADNDKPKYFEEELKSQAVEERQDDSLYQIGQANPIQRRQLLQPQSIFPLKPLPDFKYKKQNISPTLPSKLQAELFSLESHLLKDLFIKPIYSFSSRTKTSNNLQYGCLRVKYGESQVHKYLNDDPEMKSQNEDLEFESRFQSGNLSMAAQSQNNKEYYLLVSRDMNTTKCTQWFFFRVRNRIPGKYTFHILNFIKNYSVFDNGMKVCVARKSEGFQWYRAGESIKYRKTNIPLYSQKNGVGKCYYALSFTYDFDTVDEVYFAYCYPYTYSKLQNYLFKIIESNPHIKRKNVTISPGGNYVDMLTLTNFKNKQVKKRVVVITARVHPGQTPSSFVCQGIIKFLISDRPEAQNLRDNFIFKIVPMLNPDGVINGSYRCSLSGYDLNRVWNRADKISHPEIYGVRKSIVEFSESNLFLFIDLHAHSKKKGIFMYGCQNKTNPYLCRQIPFLLWKNIPEFNYYQCNFNMRKGREGTSRFSIYRELELGYSYTMEHSFCGPSKEKVHFLIKDFMEIGANILLTLQKYYSRSKKQETKNSNLQIQIFKELYSSRQLLKVGDSEDVESSSDEELDAESLPPQVQVEKNQKKRIISKRQRNVNSIEINDFQKRKMNTKSRYRVSPQKNVDVKGQVIVRLSSKGSFLPQPLPIVGPQFKDDSPFNRDEGDTHYIFSRSKACFSSLTSTHKNEEEKRSKIRESFRQSEEEDMSSLTNLFLPSLKSASYKKYGKKIPTPKNMVHIGKNLIQNARLIKEQIKGVERKKMNWKQQAKSFL